MAITTNYGWAEPDNTSLVKNGAQDIRILGDAIDASVWNIGFGQAGKNKIINGDFGIWQRGTSFSNPSSGAYTADRWAIAHDGTGATRTISQQTFTPGAAPVAGYESQYFFRYAISAAGTGNTSNVIIQRIEDVRTFANQTVTLSFWAKADASRALSIALGQDFGSGGSGGAATAYQGANLTTSWQRFSLTYSLASITGKTVGTSSYIYLYMTLPAGVTQTIDLWGAQLEYGSKATPFQEAGGGSPQAELAMCQRYCQVANNQFGQMYSTTSARIIWPVQVQMRVTPTVTYPTGTFTNFIEQVGIGNLTPTGFSASSTDNNFIYTNATGMTAGTLFNPIRYNGTTFIASSEL